ncbi:hypothetical protein M514_17990 [Trichuris suis]|uniref:Uncharacterized protein n=1 Tax=Trichuris suis TaxID=68888 RepID=A0A085NK72_9BILA|nr:hypothetical protein M514_17990 [Trichuris suis]
MLSGSISHLWLTSASMKSGGRFLLRDYHCTVNQEFKRFPASCCSRNRRAAARIIERRYGGVHFLFQL